MDFVCEICYENGESTQYQCMCPEKRCCESCINKWVYSGKNHCPYCQTKLIGLYISQNVNHIENNIENNSIYSFALNPDEHQPSGTANLARFAMSYNALRIMSGIGGLRYSN